MTQAAKFKPFDTFDAPPYRFESSCGSLPLPTPAALERSEVEARYWARLLSVPNRLFGATINHEGDAV